MLVTSLVTFFEFVSKARKILDFRPKIQQLLACPYRLTRDLDIYLEVSIDRAWSEDRFCHLNDFNPTKIDLARRTSNNQYGIR